MKYIIFGSSHAFNMAKHLGTFSGKWDSAIEGPIPITSDKNECAGHLVLTIPQSTIFQTGTANGQPAICMNEIYANHLAALDIREDICFFLLGGNEHNSLFMCRHAIPFDFYDPKYPDH